MSGKITDNANGTPLPGVNILVKGTSNGTISNVDGQYNLSIQSDNPVLVFSSIGYLTQEVPVGNQREINLQSRRRGFARRSSGDRLRYAEEK